MLPSTAATNWPVWSVGAPVLPRRLPVRLLVVRAAAADDFGAADENAGIDAERPADQAEHHHGADAEAAAPDRNTEAAATAETAAAARGRLRHCRCGENHPNAFANPLHSPPSESLPSATCAVSNARSQASVASSLKHMCS